MASRRQASRKLDDNGHGVPARGCLLSRIHC